MPVIRVLLAGGLDAARLSNGVGERWVVLELSSKSVLIVGIRTSLAGSGC